MARFLQIFAVAIASLALLGTVALLVIEPTWVADEPQLSPEESFLGGSIGAEIGPLKALMVLPDLRPDLWQPGGPEAGDWIDQYGFTRNPDRPRAAARVRDLQLPAEVGSAGADRVLRLRLRPLPYLVDPDRPPTIRGT